MITYVQQGQNVQVFLEKRHVGEIRKEEEGWRYWPRGVKSVAGAGDLFPSPSLVKRSLEDE